ncbi:hypothetical protein C0991_008677 [Blastosporella zonata]|nr:hypothetical protein C0991_008677 [Blastosporella zonata]
MAQTGTFYPGVIATGTQGVTNPPEPTMGTAINQTSMSRLISANTIEDFCIFAPPALANISDSETIEVAWCTQQRNDARLIPDGTLTGVSFLQTDNYLQILGYGDFTQLNIPFGDWGGELDPHGAYGSGNPIGGNVTSNISGADEPYAEWMLYIDYDQFCFRVCTAANSTYSAAAMCWHELDEMGCEYVMPGNYNFNGTFETCEADVAYPPGWYPTATVDGTTLFSTFAQYFTGVNPDGSGYTVGTTVTPAAPYMTPSSSNCVTTATVSNGVDLALLGISSTTAAASGSGSGATASVAKATGTAGSTGSTGTTGSAGSTTSGTSSNGASQSSQIYPVVTFISVLSGLAAVLFLH